MNPEDIEALRKGGEAFLRGAIRGRFRLVRWVPGKNHIYLEATTDMAISKRGQHLLAMEYHLRRGYLPNAEVFLKPRGDINKLRVQLRGVQV